MKRLFIVAALIAALFPLTAAAGENTGERISKSFTVAKGGDLEMNISGGDIHLVPWDKDEVTVVADNITAGDKEYLTMSQSGTTISIEYRPKWGSSGDIVFTVNIPSQFNAMVHTSGGDLSVDGKMTGKLNGSTSGGDIRTGAIDGPANLKTSGGDITLGKINGEADVKTSGGNIHIESVAKRMKAATSGGDMSVGDVGGEAQLSTSGGDISVGKVSGRVTLKTSGGNIALASANGTTEAKTAGGNIVLTKITGSIDAKTAGGNIDAELLPVGGTKSDLSTAAGDVHLALPSDAKVTVEATLRTHGGGKHNGGYSIHSDFEAAASSNDDKSEHMGLDIVRNIYKLNGGGDVITVATMNGNIVIKKIVK
jgi:DUF4097 and DUF4098 domain-containing protein YvlB